MMETLADTIRRFVRVIHTRPGVGSHLIKQECVPAVLARHGYPYVVSCVAFSADNGTITMTVAPFYGEIETYTLDSDDLRILRGG